MTSNSLTVTNQRSWRATGNRQHHSSQLHDHNPSRWQHQGGVPRPLFRRPEEDMHRPWRLFEERVRTGPFGLSRFPSRPHSPARVLVLDDDLDDRVNPMLTQFIMNSPPRIRGEWHLGPAAEPTEDPGLSDDEFRRAMKKLRKQVYNPPYPRRWAWRRGLFSRRTNNINNSNAAADDDDDKEDGKDCTVCLEAFMPSEQVLVTPCNHMFHNDCLVPWVRIHGKCPVCRFVLCERKENGGALVPRSSSVQYRNYSGARELDDELALDLITLIRAMEEAFGWINQVRVNTN